MDLCVLFKMTLKKKYVHLNLRGSIFIVNYQRSKLTKASLVEKFHVDIKVSWVVEFFTLVSRTRGLNL